MLTQSICHRVISQPEDIRAFHSDSNKHEKARSSNAGWLFHQLMGDCMGLINGTRWKKLRSEFEAPFLHRNVIDASPIVDHSAAEYMETIGNGHADEFVMEAARIVSRYPFFSVAQWLYGPLSEDEKEVLWEIGSKSLSMMGYVLSGGLFRFSIAPYLYRKTMRDLEDFRTAWTAFNETMYHSRSSLERRFPIVGIWQGVIDNAISKQEVGLIVFFSGIHFPFLIESTGSPNS